MKKLTAVILLVALTLACVGCGSAPETGSASELEQVPADTLTSARESEDTAPDRSEESPAEPTSHSTVMVVYFSATGTTRDVAEKIAALTGAELTEIVPALPYTSEDLNYNDSASRATVEQNTPDSRPEIANQISLDSCKTLYLGYPIWWGQAPRILSSFVESHDFTGITVVPFCTSGSSDIGQSDDTLAALAGSGTWLQGRRFPGGVSEEELEEWITDLGIANMEKTLHLTIDDTEVSVDWEENEAVEALIESVSSAPLTVRMSMYGGFEQVGSLGMSLPRNDIQTTTQAGDIVLYSGDQLVVLYGSNSWAYTRLGRITDRSAAELTALLGSGDITVALSYE